ncbi:MAG: hypothetical protein VKN13_02100 [Cyanobacteriota bacterium]|nr:hypothetical protein [Cyanobacteriota bacterium]
MTSDTPASLQPLSDRLQARLSGGRDSVNRVRRIQRLRGCSSGPVCGRISQRLANPVVAERLAEARSRLDLALDQAEDRLGDLLAGID